MLSIPLATKVLFKNNATSTSTYIHNNIIHIFIIIFYKYALQQLTKPYYVAFSPQLFVIV